MKKNLLYGTLGIAVIALTLLLSSFMVNSKPAPERNAAKPNNVYVKAEKVNISESESSMVYRGRFTAFDEVALASEVQGKILKGKVPFKEGEHFRKNDVLLKVYKEDVEASLKSGKSNFMQTLSKILPDLKMDYKEEFEKWNTFFNAIDVDKTLPALPQINSSKEKVFLAANNVLSSYYTLEQQEINLSRYTIRAPFDGSFKVVNKEIGAVASPGAELARIIRSDKMEITVPVFPSDLKWIKKGDKVTITSGDGELKNATVSRIAGFVDENTQSVNVFLTYNAGRSNKFLQGEYVDVNFQSTKVTGFEIPREALVDEQFVFELKDGKLQKTSIEIVRQLDDAYIINGVQEGQEIVTESLASIDPSADYLAR